MSRKAVLNAFCAGNGAFEVTARRIAGQQRSFATTSRRNAQISHFTPTSSPALDELLNTIRHKIILPSYLPQAQRRKIYSRDYEKALQSDPIIMEVDGEIFKFRHMNPFNGEIPETRRSVISALEQFQTADDFANLKPLLEGIAHSKRKFDPSFYAKILRVVGVKGRIYDIIECARSVKRTGYKLDSSEKVNELLHFVQLKAIDSEFDEAETRQALRWAEMVVEIIQGADHQPRRRQDELPVEGELPLNRDPMVLMAPLHLAAALVVKHQAGDEVLEKAVKYANDIVQLWPAGNKLREVQPTELYNDHDKLGYLLNPNKFVSLASPLLHGLEMAMEAATKASSSELAEELRSRRDTLATDIHEARESVRENPKANKPGRGETIYRKLYGS